MTTLQTQTTALGRLGKFAYRRRGLVVLAWILTIVVAFGASSKLGGEWSGN